MDLSLKDKVALITGASRGIGRAIAFTLAEEGAALALVSRSEKEIRKTAGEISALRGIRVHAEARDLLKPEEIRGFIEGAIKALGHIDILVNNLGAGITKPFGDLSEEDWREAFDKNLWAALRFSRALVPMMKARKTGKIINIAALSGKVPRQGQIASNVAKAALISFTASLAAEVGSYGIRVNAVCPAAILTERWEARVARIAKEKGRGYEETLSEFARSQIPAGRFGKPEDVAALVAFLASEKSDFIHGTAIEVDGGIAKYVSFEFE